MSGTVIRLEWQDNSSDESGFRLERSPDGTASWTAVTSPGANVTSIDDTGLTEGTTRFYRVAAVGTGGTSGFSNVAEASTPAGSDATFLDVRSAIEAALPSPGTPLTSRNLLDEVRAVGAAASGIAGVDSVLVFEETLTTQIVYDDGVVHLFINNRTDDEAASLAAPTPGPAPAGQVATRSGSSTPATSDGPPTSSRAVVAFHDGGDPLANEVAAMLSEAGYEVLPLGASLDDMRNYSNLGMLYLDTHGGNFVRILDANGTASNVGAFALQTSTVLQSLTPWKDELLDGALVVVSSTDASGVTRHSIGVTELFIARHWSFDDGVMVGHVCFLGRAPFIDRGSTLDPRPFRQTILAQGARVLMSFDHLTWHSYARPSVLHFLSRMLGSRGYDPPSPPLRPFDFDQVVDDMTDRDLLKFHRPGTVWFGNVTTGGNDVNVVFSRLAGRTTLAPSIRTMNIVDDVDEGSGLLTIEGLFGAQPGRVAVSGQDVPVDSWAETTIVARPPFQGAGSVGPVMVVKPTGVESNATPLTEWQGTVTVETEVQGLVATASMDVRFRADVHRFRTRLQDEPEHREVSTYFSPASTGSILGSGSRIDGQVTTEWYGQNDMDILPARFVDQGAFPLTNSVMGGVVRLDPDGGEAEICIAAWGYVNARATGPNGTILTNPIATFLTPDIVDRMRGFLGCVDVSLDASSFVIGAGRNTHSTAAGNFSLEWTDFTPVAPPDVRTAG
ncbi:MAG: fibronectin type III domain-containing protein [Acidimicrobiia bacterium]|nr:fibronectin type III domain-containing protein [Acidimicrobiia bacterium]